MQLHHNITGFVCRKNLLEGNAADAEREVQQCHFFFLPLKTFNIELVEAINLTYGFRLICDGWWEF